jgi:predicted nucleotidyltransferase
MIAMAMLQAGVNPTRERAIEQLRRMVLDALGDREAEVWLFGSCARGDVRQHSDIDIAILQRAELPANFFAVLAADIADGPIAYDVDLVDLRRADPALVEEVRREGILWRA